MTNEQPKSPAGHAGRFLIVNADDFGRTHGVNRGIMYAHEHGIVTSASLMVRWPAAEAAAASARGHRALSVGLHVDLGEWAFRGGDWRTVYEVVPLDDAQRVAAEVARQIEVFGQLMDCPPTHLDSHQHVHRNEPVRSVLREAAERLDVPLRGESDLVLHRGGFFAQTGIGDPLPDAITVGALAAMICGLPEGVTEFGCHPADGVEAWSSYAAERDIERRTLCDPHLREVIAREGISLVSFHHPAQTAPASVSKERFALK